MSAFVHRREVRFQDVDAAGIVFFPRLFEYFHDAYMAFYASVGVRIDEVIRARSWIVPLKHAEADYTRPLYFGDELEVSLATARLDGSKLVIGYLVTRGGDEVARGMTVHIFVDATTFARLEPPAELRDAFNAIGA